MKDEKSERDPEKRARRRLIVRICAAVTAVVLLAAVTGFFPLNALLPAAAVGEREEGELRLHFLDVGQGDCTIVEFPTGKVLVVDAGDGSFSERNKLIRYLKGLAPASVSMLLTHADADHYGGFQELLEVFGAETFYLPLYDSSAEGYRALLGAIEGKGCKTERLTRYGLIEDGSGAYCVCLSPRLSELPDENESSATLYLSYGGVRALLCADITAEREELLLGEYGLMEGIFDVGDRKVVLNDIEILKVAHHGSASSSSEEWISLLSPETAIVSCGAGNLYGHPAPSALHALRDSRIYRLDELGDVVIGIGGGSYRVEWRKG